MASSSDSDEGLATDDSVDDPRRDDADLWPLLHALARAPDVALDGGRLPPGARVGSYEVLGHVGHGGMGTVYRARDVATGRLVALKRILHEGEPRARLAREARALAALDHPNIVAIVEVGESDGAPFLALELLDGETLRARLRRGRLDVDDAVARALEIFAALAAAHEHGLVHRDLKPENLFLTRAGPLKVLDFGLAKQVALEAVPPSGDLSTAAGILVGTVAYMAPEQLRGEAVDARTDLFAAGAVLHEMLAGRRPFAAATSADIVRRILGAEPPALDDVAPGVSPALAAVVERCLAKHPSERFASASEAADALRAAVRGESLPRSRPAMPVTRYARSGDVHIGYQSIGNTSGEGSLAIVIVPGFVSNIEQLWEDPTSARLLRRFAASARLVLFDKRGSGLSDRVEEPGALSIEHRVDDIRAVMDDAGLDRAVLLGVSEGAPISIRFAVTYPERTQGLALYGGYAAFRASAAMTAIASAVRDGWGTGQTLDVFGPSVASDPAKRRWWARWERHAASPGAALHHLDVLTRIDVSAILGMVRVPTLIVHRTGDRIVPVAAGQHLADRIPGAQLALHDGDDHLIMLGDADLVGDDVLAFARVSEGAVPAARDAAALVVVDEPAGCRELAFASARAALEAAIEIAIAGGRAAIVARDGVSPSIAAARARAVLAHAADGEVLVTAEIRGLTWRRDAAFDDRGIHAMGAGEPASRLFAIR